MERFEKILISLFFVAISFTVFAQAPADTSVLLIAEHMPEYPGGLDSLFKEISSKVRYPKICVDSAIQGKVFLRFIVETDGNISNIQVLKSPHPLLSISAMEAVQGVGKFKPGMQNGKPARVWYNVPVSFKIKTKGTQSKSSAIVVKNIADFYPGGAEAYERFVRENILIPLEASSTKLDAVILVRCKVNASLKLEPVEILNSLKNIFDAEVVRLISKMPPLTDSIKTVGITKVLIVAPITFAVNNPDGIKMGQPHDYYNEGVKYFKSANFSNALTSFNDAIKLNPRDGDAFFNRATTKLRLNEPGACEDYMRAFLLGVLDAKKIMLQTCK